MKKKGKTRGTLVEVFREDTVKKLICKMLAKIFKYLKWE